MQSNTISRLANGNATSELGLQHGIYLISHIIKLIQNLFATILLDV